MYKTQKKALIGCVVPIRLCIYLIIHLLITSDCKVSPGPQKQTLWGHLTPNTRLLGSLVVVDTQSVETQSVGASWVRSYGICAKWEAQITVLSDLHAGSTFTHSAAAICCVDSEIITLLVSKRCFNKNIQNRCSSIFWCNISLIFTSLSTPIYFAGAWAGGWWWRVQWVRGRIHRGQHWDTQDNSHVSRLWEGEPIPGFKSRTFFQQRSYLFTSL